MPTLHLWYIIISGAESRSLKGADLWGFLHAQESEVKGCQGNRNDHAAIPDAVGSLTVPTVRNTGKPCGTITTVTNALPTATRNTAGVGNESETATLRHTRCANAASRKVGTLPSRKCITSFPSRKAATTGKAI